MNDIYREMITTVKTHQWGRTVQDAAKMDHTRGEIIGDIYLSGIVTYDCRRQGETVKGDTLEEITADALRVINDLRAKHWDCYPDDNKWRLCYR